MQASVRVPWEIRRGALVGLALVTLFLAPLEARAICDVIPGVVGENRAAVGASNTPYASPGDLVGLDLKAAICDGDSPGFQSNPLAHVVTVLFVPPVGPPGAAVIAGDCGALTVEIDACNVALGGTLVDPRVTCQNANQPGQPKDLFSRAKKNRRRLFFRFPDTDAQVGTPTDGRTRTGPAKIVVTQVGDPLRCDVATTRCADTNGTTACIDELYDLDGTCRRSPQNIDETFAHFVALPKPNDYSAVCSDPLAPAGPCTASATEIRFAVDPEGNAYIPWDYRGVLVEDDGVPVARLGEGSTTFEPIAGLGGLLQIPKTDFLGSFNQRGTAVPPIFTPLGAGDSLFGTIDAPRGISRILRRSPDFLECVGPTHPGLACTVDQHCGSDPGDSCAAATCRSGGNDGLPCSDDGDCPGGECGPALFEFRDRLSDGGIGPVIVTSSDYEVAAELPVPLLGLNENEQVFAFVVNEALEGVGDTNGDGDSTDFVVTASNRDTGVPIELQPAVAAGFGVSRFRRPPFNVPAVEIEADRIAFLVAEPVDGDVDRNGDGDPTDVVVKVVDQFGVNVIPGSEVAVASDPVIDNAPIALSDGLLFHVFIEAGNIEVTPRQHASFGLAGAQADGRSRFASITPDGRFVVFESTATNLVAGDTNGVSDIFRLDRDPDMNGVLDEPGLVTLERVSLTAGGLQMAGLFGGGAFSPSMSWDGNLVAFESFEPDLVAGDTNVTWDVFVRNISLGTTTRVSVRSNGTEPTAILCSGFAIGSFEPFISPNGRHVTFESCTTDMVPGDTNTVCDPTLTVVGCDSFVHDQVTGATVRISVSTAGAEGFGFNSAPSFSQPEDPNFFGVRNAKMSFDGSIVAFDSQNSYDPNDGDAFADGYLRLRDVSGNGVFDEPGDVATILATRRAPGLVHDGSAVIDSVTPDGEVWSFSSDSSAHVPGDTNGFNDVFVLDLSTDEITLESVNSSGEPAVDGASGVSVVSGDGRLIGFGTASSNLVSDDINSGGVFMFRNRQTGFVRGRGAAAVSARARGPFGTSPDLTQFAISFEDSNEPTDNNSFDDVFTVFVDPSLGSNPTKDLNSDGDFADFILRVLDVRDSPGQVTVLGPVKTASVAGGRTLFLRTEQDVGGASDIDLNSDGDAEDFVVQLWTGRGNPVVNLGRAATRVSLSDQLGAALIDEAADGGNDCSGDSVADDLCLLTFSTDGLTTTTVGTAADDFHVTGTRVAFITPESSDGVDRTLDGDTSDRVIRLWDQGTSLVTEILDGAGRAQPAEDAVLGDDLLAFRTRELAFCNDVPPEQCAAPPGCAIALCDMNADGDCCDDVLQTVEFASSSLLSSENSVVPCALEACEPESPYRVKEFTVRFLTDEAQDGRDLNDDGDALDLLVQTFNLEEERVRLIGEVARVGEEQTGIGSSIDPLDDPPLEDEAENSQVFITVGICLEDLGTPCATELDCGAGEFCEATSLRCNRQGDTCRVGIEGDCAPGEVCIEGFAVASAQDSDLDEILDPLDNCPAVSNVDQVDVDLDGVGDACDLAICGNGVVEPAVDPDEECDDGNLDDTDGCTRFCRFGGCFGDVDLDGEVDEADAEVVDIQEGCFPCSSGACFGPCDGNDDGLVNNVDMLMLQNLLGTSCASAAGSSGGSADDADGDGVEDAQDNCPWVANPGQEDQGGVQTSVGDDVGDACQCGDMNGDGVVNATDVTLYRRYFTGLSSPFSEARCSVVGVGGVCDAGDVTVMRRMVAGLPPGVSQVCASALAPTQ